MSDTTLEMSDEDLDLAEMPVDELEDDEEEITEIPVHGVATLEGKPTGDGRGFRGGGLSFGKLPAPLGYEYVSTHGGMTSDVAIVGRIDEFWTVPAPDEGEGVFEVRWRGVIMPGKEYGARAIESIIDGSYTGVSVIVDDVEVDVEERREEMRSQILRDQERQSSPTSEDDGDELAAKSKPMTEEQIEELLDAFIGDGKQQVTWYKAARIRRFDMVPTGAFQEGYTALGAEFPDELDEEALVAAAAALEDCGCGRVHTIRAEAGTALFDLSGFTDDELEEYNALEGEAQDEYARTHGAIVASAYAPGTKDGPGWITHPTATARIRRYWVRGKGAAKIRWGVPGDFNRCRMQLAKYVQNPDWLAGLCANMHKEAIGVWPGQEGGGRHSIAASAAQPPLFSLVAAAAPVDVALFQRVDLEEPVGVEIDGDHVYGYVALWNVCHIGEPAGRGTCTYAPRSATNYAHFRTGTVMTTEGRVAVGSITMNTGHAGGRLSAAAAAAHYDNTGTVIADVVVGEDQFGIWYSGRKRPGVSDDDVYAAMASGRVSGDWRMIGGNYELVGALVVNVAGYPMAQHSSLVASADFGITAIIGEGIVPLEAEAITASVENAVEPMALTPDLVVEIAITAAERALFGYKRDLMLAELQPAREALQAHSLRQARARLALLSKES